MKILKENFEEFINEHHGDEWNPAFLNQSVDRFLTKLKNIDEEKYKKVEEIISSVIDNF